MVTRGFALLPHSKGSRFEPDWDLSLWRLHFLPMFPATLNTCMLGLDAPANALDQDTGTRAGVGPRAPCNGSPLLIVSSDGCKCREYISPWRSIKESKAHTLSIDRSLRKSFHSTALTATPFITVKYASHCDINAQIRLSECHCGCRCDITGAKQSTVGKPARRNATSSKSLLVISTLWNQRRKTRNFPL